MGYVKLKHTLSRIALDAIEHPERSRVVDALLAYARRGREPHGVPLTTLGRATGETPLGVVRLLGATGLFDEPAGGGSDRIALAAPFRPFASYLRRQSARTAVAIRLLRSTRRPGIPEEIWRAAALFNAGLFFECHEYLEDVWRSTPGPERAFYHGLVQAAAGCYHLEKGNAHGAHTLIQKAIAKLEPYTPAHREVDVAAFLAGLREVLGRLDRGSPLGEPVRPAQALPTMALVDSPPRRRRRVRACGPAAPVRSSRARDGAPPR